MHRNVLVLAILALAPAAFAQGLSQGDRDRILSHMHGTRKLTIDAVAGLTDAQLKFKPADNRWSIGEVLEHLVLAERGLFAMTRKTAAGPNVDAPPAGKPTDEAVLKGIASREQKAQSPEMFLPTGRFGAKTLDEYKAARTATLDYARETQDELRKKIAPSPIGPLDGAQWLLFISAHNERHLGQIAEIKADAKYPK